ncbi:hypothetical protein [Haladaptatus litoreus]|nr:hypothetical protein [Haladaptatus litoreus]
MTNYDFEPLRRKQNLLTTLVLFLVFIELVRILTTWDWDPIRASAAAVFFTAIAWLLAYFSS